MKLKDQVEKILQLYPKARDCDITLMILIWEIFYPNRIIKSTNGQDKAINIKSLYILPREDHIKRYRAKFQNDELKYLPTTFEVAKKRRISEIAWRSNIK